MVKVTGINRYLLAILCIFVTDAVVLPIGSGIKTIGMSLICLFAWLKITISPKCKAYTTTRDQLVFYVYFPIITILLSQLGNLDFSLGYEYKIFLLLGGFAFASMVRFPDFMDAFINVMFMVAICSVFVWVLSFWGMDFWSGLPQTGENEYYSLGVTVVHTNRGLWYRNFGPFWEPGVYHIYLNFCIAYLLLFKKNFPLIKLIVFIITLISTFSTTGFACFIVIIFSYFIKRLTTLNLKVFLALTSLFAGVCLLLTNEYINIILFGKIADGSTSFDVRMMDSKLYLKMFLQNPIFGIGLTDAYNQVQKLYEHFGIDYSGASSTTFREFASMGLYLGTIRLLLQWKFAIKFLNKRMLPVILFFAVILIMLNTEDLCFSLFLNMIFYYAILKVRNNETEKLNISYSKL